MNFLFFYIIVYYILLDLCPISSKISKQLMRIGGLIQESPQKSGTSSIQEAKVYFHLNKTVMKDFSKFRQKSSNLMNKHLLNVCYISGILILLDHFFAKLVSECQCQAHSRLSEDGFCLNEWIIV